MKIFFLLSLLAGSLYANPEGMKVVSGSAAITNNQKEMNVQTGEQTIINWEKFSIAKDELTRFSMPSTTSSVLNRVTSKEMSQILGKLESNGRVYLLNPNGVLIGKDAFINAASFIASSYDVLDSEFLKNGDLCFSGDSREKVVNLGTIKAFDGDAILIGRYVQNEGSINAEKGVVSLAAGKEILLKPLDRERIYIRPSLDSQKDETTGIENNGEIKAASSYLKADGNLYSLAIKNSGKIDALSFEEKGGDIFLIAENSIVESSSAITARKELKGGEVRLLGKNVGLLEKASIDVSHDNGNGVVLLGGDYQGKNENIYNAKAVFVGKDTVINASSLKDGNGGKVILWSDDCTKFYGNILAEGGKIIGDGGFVEISGAFLDYRGLASTNALNGKVGDLLLDPNFLDITFAASAPPLLVTPPNTTYDPPGPSANLNIPDLENALAVSNVLITNSGSSLDTMTVQGSVQWASSNNLTISWTGGIYVAGNAVGGSGFNATGGGNINITGDVFVGRAFSPPPPPTNLSSFIKTNGNISINGEVVLIGGTDPSATASIEAGGTLSGTIHSINMQSGSTGDAFINADSINIDLNGTDITMFVPSGATGDCNISSITGDLVIRNVNNIFLDSFGNGAAFINSTSGNIRINEINARGSGGVFLNHNSGTHSGGTSISTIISGDVACFFSGNSIIDSSTNSSSSLESRIGTTNGNVTFYGNELDIIDGTDDVTGISTDDSGSIDLHLDTLKITESRALATGGAGIITSKANSGAGNITGSIRDLEITSGGGNAFLQTVTTGSINISNLDNAGSTIKITSGGAANAFISTNSGNLIISKLNSVEIIPTSNDAFISSNTGNIQLNTPLVKGNFLLLNNAAAAHSAYIATKISGNVECYFAGPATSIIQGGASGSDGIFSGFNAGGTGGNITFSSGNLNIIAGAGGNAGIFSGYKNGALSGSGNITFNTSILNITSSTGRAGIIAGTTATANITNSSSTSINITSGNTPASISAPNGSLTITKGGDVSLTASGTADCFIGSLNDLTMLLTNKITTNSNSGRTFIQTTGGGKILINDFAAEGSGGITLNATPASNNFPSFIATQNGGDIECNFSGSSFINGGASLGAFSGIITGLAAVGGSINIKNGALVLNGGSGSNSFATIQTKTSGNIAFSSVGNIDITAGNVGTGSYASIETATGGSILVFFAKGYLNLTAKSPANSYAVVRAGTGGFINCSFTSLSTFQAGSGAGAIAGVFSLGGDLSIHFQDLRMIGGSGSSDRAAIEIAGTGNIVVLSDGNINLLGGTSADCFSQIQTNGGGSITISGNNIITLQAGSSTDCAARIQTTAGGNIEIGNSLSKNTQLNLIGGSFTSSSALVQTGGGAGDINISSLKVSLQGGSASFCSAAILTQFSGAINISCDGLLSLQGGTSNSTLAEIQTSGGGGAINILAGEVFLNSSLTDAASLAAIIAQNPTSFVTVITNGSLNAPGDISIIANAAPAFISNAIRISASHDLILESVNNDAYILTTSSSPFFIPSIEVGNELIMDGSPNTANVAKITPIGAPTGIIFNIHDDAYLTANIGDCFISGYTNINMFTNDSLNLRSSSLGSAFIDSFVNANFNVGSLNIQAAIGSARIRAFGNLFINVFDNNMTLTSLGSGNAFVQGGNTSINVNGNLIMNSFALGASFIQSIDYSLFNVGLDINLNGNANVLKTGSTPFIMTAGSSIFLNNNSFFQNDAGPFTILAGENITINGSRIENISSDDLTLVVDNNFPVPPEIGHGHFDIGSGSIIRTALGGKLRLFSAVREFNTIESPLNGVNFIPGPEFLNSNHERWGFYYPDSFFGGPGFTIFYKNTSALTLTLLSSVNFAASELFFRLNNMIDDLYILDYLQKFIDRSKYFFIEDERRQIKKTDRNLIKLTRE